MSRISAILDAKLNYLYSKAGGASVKLELDTTHWVLQELGVDPQVLPCIHVAGSNGKGSVSAMMESVLREAGIHTGLYTSPHLMRFNERIRVDGQPIPDAELSRLLDAVELADQNQSARSDARPGTFFELTTAVAFAWFLKSRVQLAVLETGLGGRLDSTNVVMPYVSVLARIDMEHTSYLGATLEKVAAEKAGIIKPGRPVVTTFQDPAVMQIIEKTAKQLNAPVIKADERVSIRRLSMDEYGQTLSIETPDGAWPPFTLPLLGDYQLGNCALAITALETLRAETGWDLSPDVIRAGLEKTEWPARCQFIQHDPPFLVDVAHNPAGASALARFIKSIKGNRPVVLISGLLEDKDAYQFFRYLRPVVDACLLVPLDSIRSMPMDRLMAAAQSTGLAPVESVLPAALRSAAKWAKDNGGMICAAGSFYLASDILFQMDIPIYPEHR